MDPRAPAIPTLLSWKSVRGKGEAERKDRESTIEWWWVLVVGTFIGVGLLLIYIL